MGSGQGRELWLLLLLLVLVVVVPTACVLWFMNKAMDSERLVVRQKLTEVYKGQLDALRKKIQTHWRDKARILSEVGEQESPAEIFAHVVGSDMANSIVLYDSTGQLAYPTKVPSSVHGAKEESPEWNVAQRLEYRQNDPLAAATNYAQIARQAVEASVAARAWQAQARCLAKAGRVDAAIEVLTSQLVGGEKIRSLGAQGHAIRANAQLLALRLMRDAGHEGYREMSEDMVRQLTDYSHFALASGQRIFLMKQVQDIVQDSPSFSTLAAELIGLAYSVNNPNIGAPVDLRPTQVDSVWQWGLPGRDRVALFTLQRIRSEVENLIQQQALPPGATVTLLAPETDPFQVGAFASIALGDPLADWWLELHLADESLFETTADRQVVIYLWIGTLVIGTLIAFAAIIAHYMRRQIQLNRLKSDLVSTVSHELKTPLASMRVLVDTLLDGHYQNEQMTQEYLQLIARENVRLSQLIDNFLTFSRLERGTQSFAFSQVDLTEVTTTAFEALRDKLEAAGFVVETVVASNAVLINGDRDALTTVVLNLLDNAYKYSDEVKHIVLRVYQQDNAAYLEVEDRGIGMAQRETGKIFERFYQVDQQLARQVEGCGLGLNIVKSIVEAHGGSITVDSRPGAGSKFIVKLPLATVPSSKKLQRIVS